MENKLGKQVGVIKPNFRRYFLEGVLGVAAILAVLFFEDMYSNYTVYGIPAIWIGWVVGPLLIILSVFNLAKSASNKENIEIYENGIKLRSFISLYKDLTVERKKGLINTKYIFNNGNEQAIFKFMISEKEYDSLKEKIKQSLQNKPFDKAEHAAVAQNNEDGGGQDILSGAQLLEKPVEIQIIREKAYVGGVIDYTIYLNGSEIGTIMNDSIRKVATSYNRNSLSFQNLDVKKTIYFEINPGQTPVIVIKTNSFVEKKCKGCKILTKEEVLS